MRETLFSLSTQDVSLLGLSEAHSYCKAGLVRKVEKWVNKAGKFLMRAAGHLHPLQTPGA